MLSGLTVKYEGKTYLRMLDMKRTLFYLLPIVRSERSSVVELHLAKVDVVSSNLIARSNFYLYPFRSAMELISSRVYGYFPSTSAAAERAAEENTFVGA